MSRLGVLRTVLYLAGFAAFLSALVAFFVPEPDLESLGTVLILAAWPLLLGAAILSIVLRLRSEDETGVDSD